MKTHIALLRGLNVGGHKILKMADLKLLFESLGFAEVTTYIQSGNVLFSSSEPQMKALILEEIISEGIKELYGFEVPVLVKEISEVEAILAACPFSEAKKMASFFTLLNQKPSEDLVKEISKLDFPDEEFIITENCVYLFSEKGYNEVKCNNNFFEKKLKVAATTRNHRTMAKLVELAK
ncbi:DUF1697 domain-containing protein [Aequorivita capsosiphonis]|uniref:DUF1697 domain-containing protein n=1 Tax=Aequorivita capsosiphonis TaxID=487317 RepID=UPI00041B69C9|nr:DUF1697 domain-containing protein [Aequorivita capsosiphonis]